ncbi:MAG: glutamate racemase [Clostridia bacterium]
MKIGFFDSGLGGLTVLKESIKQLPNEEYIYLADNLNAPYGNKPKDIVKKYIFKNVQVLLDNGVEAIVIACNTATAIAIDDLRKQYSNIKVIGTEPAVKPAIELVKNTNLKVLIVATSLTIKEEKLKLLIKKLNAEKIVDLLSLGKLVNYAESNNYNDEVIEKYLNDELKDKDINSYGVVVLGCTHFSIFRHNFENVFNKNTKIIDGNIGIVNYLKKFVIKDKNKFGNVTILMTEETDDFKNSSKNILNYDNIIYKKID